MGVRIGRVRCIRPDVIPTCRTWVQETLTRNVILITPKRRPQPEAPRYPMLMQYGSRFMVWTIPYIRQYRTILLGSIWLQYCTYVPCMYMYHLYRPTNLCSYGNVSLIVRPCIVPWLMLTLHVLAILVDLIILYWATLAACGRTGKQQISFLTMITVQYNNGCESENQRSISTIRIQYGRSLIVWQWCPSE